MKPEISTFRSVKVYLAKKKIKKRQKGVQILILHPLNWLYLRIPLEITIF